MGGGGGGLIPLQKKGATLYHAKWALADFVVWWVLFQLMPKTNLAKLHWKDKIGNFLLNFELVFNIKYCSYYKEIVFLDHYNYCVILLCFKNI